MRTRMTTFLLLLALAITCAQSAATSETLYPVQKNRKWGYINKSGTVVLKLQYSGTGVFSEGLAAVTMDGNRWGYINISGKMVIKPVSEYPHSDFHEGMARITIQDKVGFMDKTGKIVVKPVYQSGGDFSEGLAVVLTGAGPNAKSGFIDKTGKVVIPIQFNSAMDFSEGLAAVEIGGQWGFIDKTGKTVIPLKFDGVDRFAAGLAGASTGTEYYTSKKTGKTDKEIIMQPGRWGFIDKTGEWVIKPEYSLVAPFSEGMAGVTARHFAEGLWGFIDRTGKVVVEPQYLFVGSFSEGMAPALKFDKSEQLDPAKLPKWTYITIDGKTAITLTEDMMGHPAEFVDGIAAIAGAGRLYGPSYVNKAGKYIWKNPGPRPEMRFGR